MPRKRLLDALFLVDQFLALVIPRSNLCRITGCKIFVIFWENHKAGVDFVDLRELDSAVEREYLMQVKAHVGEQQTDLSEMAQNLRDAQNEILRLSEELAAMRAAAAASKNEEGAA